MPLWMLTYQYPSKVLVLKGINVFFIGLFLFKEVALLCTYVHRTTSETLEHEVQGLGVKHVHSLTLAMLFENVNP